MSGLRMKPDDLVDVYIDINGDKRKMVEEIADTVLRRVLEEEEGKAVATESTAPSSTSSNSSPLSISQLLSTSFSQQPTAPVAAPMALNPFQLAFCQSLMAGNALPFSILGGPSPFLPIFVPPPQPTAADSAELLRLLQSLVAKQKK